MDPRRQNPPPGSRNTSVDLDNSEFAALNRELPDPDEKVNPLPWFFIMFLGAIGMWGAFYIAATPSGESSAYGDQRTVALLRKDGIEQIVLVTHDYHMRRALRNFERAAAVGTPMKIVAAPMGLPSSTRIEAKDWLPVASNLEKTTIVLHEWLGYLGGA